MKKRILSFLLAVMMVFAAAPVSAGAAGEANIYAGDQTASPGWGISVPLGIRDVQDLGAVEIELYYDAEALTYNSYSANWLLDGCSVSVNADDPGVIRITAASPTGITVSGADTLLYLYFSVSSDCAPGEYAVNVAVGEAYDTALNPMTLTAASGKVTVNQSQSSGETFWLWMDASARTMHQGESVTLTVTGSASLGSCRLQLEYDKTLFRLESASLGSDLQVSDAVSSIRTDTPGLVTLAYASTYEVWAGQMLTVTLTALQDVSAESTVTCAVSDAYNPSLTPYQPSSCAATLTLEELPEEVTPGRFFAVTGEPVVGETCTTVLKLSGDSAVAAADFTLGYDTGVFRCVSVEKAEGASDAMVVINPNFDDGTVKFSYVSENGTAAETDLVLITWQVLKAPSAHYRFTLGGSGVVDADYAPVELDCTTEPGCVYNRTESAATCTESGSVTWKCPACGDSRTQITDPALCHSYGAPVFHWAADSKSCYVTRTCGRDSSHVERTDCAMTSETDDATCTEAGEIVYTATVVLDGVTYSESRTVTGQPLGHDYVSVVTEPTCTEPGYTTHTCSRCGDSFVDSHTDPRHSFGEWVADGDWEKRTCTICGFEEVREIPFENPFVDVGEKAFYYDAVMWAVKNGITSGIDATHFCPNNTCNRGQVVTFLWRAAGKPEPTSTNNPFVDVGEKAFYYKAVLWAVENGITNGLDATHFGPNSACSRGQVVTFLWRAAGKEPPTSESHSFVDVRETGFYYKAMLWAVENGITNGLDATHFGPDASCSRGQVVTFLYRTFGKS